MALIRCAECGRHFSEKAAACPTCGAPLSAETGSPQMPMGASTQAPSGVVKKGSPGATIFLGLVLSCFGLWVTAKLGDYGFPAAVIGLLACVGAVVLAVKTPKYRKVFGVGALACVLVALFGMAEGSSRATAQRQKEAEQKRLAQQKAEHDELATKLGAAEPTEAYDLCVRVSSLGGIPTDSNGRCGRAYLDTGRRLADAGRLPEAREALKQALSLAPADNEARTALARVSTTVAMQRGEEHLRGSKTAKDASSAVQLAQAAQGDLQEALQLDSSDERLRALSKRVQVQLAQARGAQAAEEAGKQREARKAAEKREAALYVKESCNRLADAFGTSSRLSELQKEEMWKQYEGKMFNWTMEFVDADSETFGSGVVAHWKCQQSESFVSDVMLSYPANARGSVLQLQKGSFYKIKGRLKHTSTLMGLTGEAL